MQNRTPYEQTQIARYGARNHHLVNDPTAPVEYITQRCEVGNLLFEVSEHTLIPRIETEELIAHAINQACIDIQDTIKADIAIKNNDKILNSNSWHPESPFFILDVGTGSGVIGISIARALQTQFPNLQFNLTLSDISNHALQVAQRNADRILGKSGWKQNAPSNHLTFTLVQSDLLNSIPMHSFHCITANLPYIPTERISTLDQSVINHEPLLALDGGEDGLHLIRIFVMQLDPYLSNQGTAWLEVDHTHTSSVFKSKLSTTLKSQSLRNQFVFDHYIDSCSKNRFVTIKKA